MFQDLVLFSYGDLLDLWEEIAAQSAVRQTWIMELDGILKQVEEERMERVREILVVSEGYLGVSRY